MAGRAQAQAPAMPTAEEIARQVLRLQAAQDAAAVDVALPVRSIEEAVPHFRRPFTPEAVRFKVQSNIGRNEDGSPKGALIVCYMDARLVVERLNRVCPGMWQEQFVPVTGANQLLVCHLTVDGVTHTDVGESKKGLSKDLWSDARKRAAVPFGIGVSLYAVPRVRLWRQHRDEDGSVGESPFIKYRSYQRDGKTFHVIELTDRGEQALRNGYAKWLEEHGARHFGAPLDHGDVGDAQGDPDEAAPLAAEEQTAEPEEQQAPAATSTAGMEPAVSTERVELIEERVRGLGLKLGNVRRILEMAGVSNLPRNLTAAAAAEALSGLSVGQAEEFENALDILEREQAAPEAKKAPEAQEAAQGPQEAQEPEGATS